MEVAKKLEVRLVMYMARSKIDSTRFLNDIKSATSDLISIKIIAIESTLDSNK